MDHKSTFTLRICSNKILALYVSPTAPQNQLKQKNKQGGNLFSTRHPNTGKRRSEFRGGRRGICDLLDVRCQILETSIQQVLLPIRKFTNSVNFRNPVLSQFHLRGKEITVLVS